MDQGREFKGGRRETETREVRVRGVSEKTIRELNNIADHCGVTVSNLLRPKIAEIIKTFPDYMHQPKEDNK